MSNAIQLIVAERQRQIETESWTQEHDDQHWEGAMAAAAACYALPPKTREQSLLGGTVLFHLWPWDREWWKPKPRDRIRELVKAGALIVAEIDRLQRSRATP